MRLTRSRIVATACLCCVRPIAQQEMIRSAIGETFRHGFDPFSGQAGLAFDHVPRQRVQVCSQGFEPVVLSATNTLSTAPFATSHFITPCRNAWSPPILICR